jgi:hypothetical protein
VLAKEKVLRGGDKKFEQNKKRTYHRIANSLQKPENQNQSGS